MSIATIRKIYNVQMDAAVLGALVAQCSATPATVAATHPPVARHLFRQPNSVRHLPAEGGGGATPEFLGGVARHRCYTCKTL